MASYPDMARCMRRGIFAASFHVPQEHRVKPRTLFRTSFKPFKDNAVANEKLLIFGQSYWDYLPDLGQNKIVKMVHKDFLKEVHLEILALCKCTRCGKMFMNPFESKRHYLEGVCCNPNYLEGDYESDYESDYDCDCEGDCDCEMKWDDWWERLRCECCGRME